MLVIIPRLIPLKFNGISRTKSDSSERSRPLYNRRNNGK